MFRSQYFSIFFINKQLNINIIKIYKNNKLNEYLRGFSNILYNNKYIITFCGYNIDDIYIYSILNNKWFKSKLKLNKKIYQSSAIIFKNNIHVIGGQDKNYVYLDSYYDIDVSYVLNYEKEELLNNETIR